MIKDWWHHHPGVRSGSELTFGERAADGMRNGMGSWGFVFGALGFLMVWMGLNIWGHWVRHWDPYPFILLNLTLSCLAAMQGAILLIAAKRSDQVSAEQALHHYQETTQHQQMLATMQEMLGTMQALLDENTKLTKKVAEKS